MEYLIRKEEWKEDSEGKFFVSLKYEGINNERAVVNFVHGEEYINEHKEDFEALLGAESDENTCTLYSNKALDCDINVNVVKESELDGKIITYVDEEGNERQIFKTTEELTNEKIDAILNSLINAMAAAEVYDPAVLRERNGLHKLIHRLEDCDLFFKAEDQLNEAITTNDSLQEMAIDFANGDEEVDE